MNKLILWLIVVLAIIVVGVLIFKPSSDTTTDEENEENDLVLTGETKEFDITASNWKFEPSLIEVNLGDKVELHLQSTQGTHGFTIMSFGVSETLTPGEDIHVEFIADRTGTFSFFCHIPCGQGHGGMNGKLIVN